MKVTEINIPNKPIQPEAQDTTMAQNQLLKIGQQAIKIENMIANNQEISEWASNKINLVSEYVKKVHGYIQNEKAPPGREDQVKALKGKFKDKGAPYAIAWSQHNKHGKPKNEAPIEQDHNNPVAKPYVDMPEWKALHDMDDKIIDAYIKHKEVKEDDDIKNKAMYHINHHLNHARGILDKGRFSDSDELEFQDHYNEIDALINAKAPNSDILAKMRQHVPGVDDSKDEIRADLIKMIEIGKTVESVEEDGMTPADVDRVKNQHFTTKQIKHAYRVLNHPSVKGGNYTAAYNIINRIAPGLADHPDVANALRRANESLNEQAVRVKTDVEGDWGGHRGKVLDKDDDGNWLVGFGNEADWFKETDLEFIDDEYGNDADSDTAGEVPMLDPEFEEDAGEGHMSKGTLYHTAKYAIELASMIKPGDDLEGWVQSKLNKAADYLQGAYNYEEYQKLNPYREELDSNTLSKHAQVVQKHIDEILARETALDDIDTKPGMMRILNKKVNEVEKELAKENRKAQENMQYEDMLMNKLDSAMQEYDSPEKKAQRDALMKKYLAKGGKIEKVPTGKTAYKGKELKPAYKKDNGTPITSPGSDESVEEDGAPFGSGMDLVRMAVTRKFISAEEYMNYAKELKAAGEEVEQNYDDWPEGEGFGSSDHNFAIRDLMSAAGYEFDDKDTSGRFIVTKMPEKLEKLGIKNVRMQGEPVATEERQEGFAVRYSLDGKRKAQAYRSEKDAQHRAEILRSMGGVKDVSITKHTFNFKKESAYESKLARMLNQQLK